MDRRQCVKPKLRLLSLFKNQFFCFFLSIFVFVSLFSVKSEASMPQSSNEISLNSAKERSTSQLIPLFFEAVKIVEQNSFKSSLLMLNPQLKAAVDVLLRSQINFSQFDMNSLLENKSWLLEEDDQYDAWVKSSFSARNKKQSRINNNAKIALHALKMDVVKTSDDFFKDDIYVYFFITDGVIPTGKVTSTYKGLSAGQSFFFTQEDRKVFPLVDKLMSKSPSRHLIIDYGIIESDGDDIKELQKISDVIIDLAIAVYSTYKPESSKVLINLRKEVKALSQLLLSLNHDDRMATGTVAFNNDELAQMLGNRSYIEIKKEHFLNERFNNWEYNLYFRILKDE